MRRQHAVCRRCPCFGAVVRPNVGRGGRRRAAVGYDGRLTSPEFEPRSSRGSRKGGADVVASAAGRPDAVLRLGDAWVDGGIMVTGSHNPPDHNGFKIVLGGKPVFRRGDPALGRRRWPSGRPKRRAAGSTSTASSMNTSERVGPRDYERLRAGSGRLGLRQRGTGEVVARLVQKLPGRHILINETIDGPFRRTTRTRRSPRTSCSCSRW